MKRTILFLLCLSMIKSTAHAQTQWVLQPYLQYFGHERGPALGARVKGFVGSRSNNPYNLAVAESHQLTDTPRLRFYTINSPQDTAPRWVIPGAGVEHGDFNDDGLTDFAIWKSVNYSRFDTVLIYLGKFNDIDTIPTLKLAAEKERSEFGARMCIGDLNNDGIDDLVITAEFYQAEGFQSHHGKVYVHFGGPSLKSKPDITFTGSHAGAGLGTNCAIGDFNNDTFNDLAIRGYDQFGPVSFGYLKIYLGSANLDTVADLTSPRAYRASTLYGLTTFDVNKDHKVDLLWTFVDSSSSKHSVFVHYAGRDFESRFKFKPDFKIQAPLGSAFFGNEICSTGDMNGDGNEELAIAAYLTGQGNGIVFIYTGGGVFDDQFDAARGQALEGAFGTSINGVGDIDHDGYDDIVVGAPNQPWTRYEGYFGIFLGDSRIPTSVEAKNSISPSGFALHPNYPNPFHQLTTFEFSLPYSALIQIKIYDILGKEVKTLLDTKRAAGQYEVLWDGKDEMDSAVPNGVYFARMKAFGAGGLEVVFERTQKFTVVK